jgi:hypothetical protein
MPCPFPGMDPYLEMQPFWSDFAPTFIGEIRNALLARLLPRYDVRMEEYVMLTENDYNLHRLRPDVTVSATNAWEPAKSTGAAVAEPVTTELDYPDYEPLTQRRLKIIRLPHERVVTAIEVLSPANKVSGEGGLDAYLEKRAELLACQCNLVELDLLRGGQRLPMSGPLPPADYYAFIGRVGKKPRCHVVGWSLRAPLPAIDIPLLAPDPDIQLDLQSVFRSAYEPAFYDRRLRYDQPLEPPLRPDDQQWMRDRLPSEKRNP